jgi:hypothetical protein
MILSSRILRTITIATSAAAIGTGSIAAIAPAAAAGVQFTASRLAGHSPRQPFVADCQGDVNNATETRSGEHKYVG